MPSIDQAVLTRLAGSDLTFNTQKEFQDLIEYLGGEKTQHSISSGGAYVDFHVIESRAVELGLSADNIQQLRAVAQHVDNKNDNRLFLSVNDFNWKDVSGSPFYPKGLDSDAQQKLFGIAADARLTSTDVRLRTVGATDSGKNLNQFSDIALICLRDAKQAAEDSIAKLGKNDETSRNSLEEKIKGYDLATQAVENNKIDHDIGRIILSVTRTDLPPGEIIALSNRVDYGSTGTIGLIAYDNQLEIFLAQTHPAPNEALSAQVSAAQISTEPKQIDQILESLGLDHAPTGLSLQTVQFLLGKNIFDEEAAFIYTYSANDSTNTPAWISPDSASRIAIQLSNLLEDNTIYSVNPNIFLTNAGHVGPNGTYDNYDMRVIMQNILSFYQANKSASQTPDDHIIF